jgi:hypothetical protein
MCVHKVLQRHNFFCCFCKKEKMCHEKTYKQKKKNFCIGHIKNRFFLERLCAHIACEAVRTNFLELIFDISKYV